MSLLKVIVRTPRLKFKTHCNMVVRTVKMASHDGKRTCNRFLTNTRLCKFCLSLKTVVLVNLLGKSDSRKLVLWKSFETY